MLMVLGFIGSLAGTLWVVKRRKKMGQHKHNPTAIAAKNGELPPKEQPRLSKRQMEALMRKHIDDVTGVTEIHRYLGNGGSFYI